MAKLLSVADLQRVLGGHRERFSRCVWPAWERYIELPEVARLTFDLAAEAKVINRFVIDTVKREFAGVPGVEFLKQYDLLGIEGFPFGLEESVVCRFKKLNGLGQSRAYPTSRAKAILQNETEQLDGIPEQATIVDIGPVINDLRTGFRDVQAVRVKDTKFIMSFPRSAGASGVQPTSLPFPFSPAPSAPRFIIAPRAEGSDSEKQ